jgi:hypothetical protein
MDDYQAYSYVDLRKHQRRPFSRIPSAVDLKQYCGLDQPNKQAIN